MRIVMGVLALLLMLSACSEDTPEPEAEPTPGISVDQSLREAAEGLAKEQPGYGEVPPECVKVWRAGKRLPKAYAGCAEVGRMVRKVATPCVDGTELVSFGELWAKGRQPIRRGSLTGPDYQRVYQRCIGR